VDAGADHGIALDGDKEGGRRVLDDQLVKIEPLLTSIQIYTYGGI
jgi:hypothetical protein